MSKNWIAGAIKHPGSLRKALHVKGDKDIPAKKLNAAAKKGGKIGKKAQLAKTLKSFHHGMQMGPSGFGVTHGEADMSEGDGSDDNSHEFRGC